MKKLAFTTTLALLSSSVLSAGGTYSQEIKCDINGCIVKCAIDDEPFKSVAKGSSVVLKSLSNGSTIFEVTHSMGSKSTVIVGSKGYICQVSGQKG